MDANRGVKHKRHAYLWNGELQKGAHYFLGTLGALHALPFLVCLESSYSSFRAQPKGPFSKEALPDCQVEQEAPV
jgi:hypothetical protein